jgi:hypothetical protein
MYTAEQINDIQKEFHDASDDLEIKPAKYKARNMYCFES